MMFQQKGCRDQDLAHTGVFRLEQGQQAAWAWRKAVWRLGVQELSQAEAQSAVRVLCLNLSSSESLDLSSSDVLDTLLRACASLRGQAQEALSVLTMKNGISPSTELLKATLLTWGSQIADFFFM